MKKILTVFLVIMLFCCLTIPAYAVEPAAVVDPPTAEPCFQVLTVVSSGIDISAAKTAICTGIARGSSNSYTLKVTMNLQQKIDGSWTSIAFWKTTGTGPSGVSFSKIKQGLSSGIYRTRVYVGVYDSSGNFVESTTVYSQNMSC